MNRWTVTPNDEATSLRLDHPDLWPAMERAIPTQDGKAPFDRTHAVPG